MLGAPCNPCCASCGCDIPPSQVLMTASGVNTFNLLAGASSVLSSQEDQWFLQAARSGLIDSQRPMQYVAVRDDSVAPYGGYGFSFQQWDVFDSNASFTTGILSGGGQTLFAGLSGQTLVSQPRVTAVVNAALRRVGARLWAYFIKNNPGEPTADRYGNEYCMKFGGSISHVWAFWLEGSGETFLTTPHTLLLTCEIADSGYPFGYTPEQISYPALYVSSFGSSRPRTFPSPYICMPNNTFSASANAFFLDRWDQSFVHRDFLGSNIEISLQFSGGGIPSNYGGNRALPP